MRKECKKKTSEMETQKMSKNKLRKNLNNKKNITFLAFFGWDLLSMTHFMEKPFDEITHTHSVSIEN